jgi:hypothetical protein
MKSRKAKPRIPKQKLPRMPTMTITVRGLPDPYEIRKTRLRKYQHPLDLRWKSM